MPKITIELDLGPGYEQDPETGEFYPTDHDAFETQIREHVAEQLLKRATTINGPALRKRIDERLEEAIDGAIGAEIAAVLAGPLQRYDYNGRPKGEPFTVNELVVQAVEQFANAPAVRDGFSSSANAGAKSLAELVEKTVQEALRKDLAADVAAIRKSVAEEIRARLTGAAADAIAKGR